MHPASIDTIYIFNCTIAHVNIKNVEKYATVYYRSANSLSARLSRRRVPIESNAKSTNLVDIRCN